MSELVISQYQELKEKLDVCMGQAVENFVQIGYLLRRVKEDESLLDGSEYSNYKEFAKSEYGLEETQVSRFISINEKYGDGATLLPQYRGFGQSKLAEMLSLPQAVVEELPKDITRQEIRDIKQEIAEENKISDIEVAIERAETPVGDIWEAFLNDWIKRNPERYIEIDAFNEYETLFRGCALIARVAGEGKLMLTETDGELTLTNMRTGEKKKEAYETIENLLDRITCAINANPFTKESWELLTGEKYPEIAPAQVTSDTVNKPKTEQKELKTEEKSEKVTSDIVNKPIVEDEELEKVTVSADDVIPKAADKPISFEENEPKEENVEEIHEESIEKVNEEETTEETLKAAVQEEPVDYSEHINAVKFLMPRLTEAFVRNNTEEMKSIAGHMIEELEAVVKH